MPWRGMLRSAPMLVATVDGLRPIVLVRPAWLRGDDTPDTKAVRLPIRSPWNSALISRQVGSDGSEAPF
jgi:hypothetical protein